jgi:hypothetical protein
MGCGDCHHPAEDVGISRKRSRSVKRAWLVAVCLLWSATAVGSENGVHSVSSMDFSSARGLLGDAEPCSFDGEPDRDAFAPRYDESEDEIAPEKGINRYAVDSHGVTRLGLEQKGRRLTPPIFDILQPIEGDLLQVVRGNCQGVIDIHGATVLPLAYLGLSVEQTNEDRSVVLVGRDTHGMQLIRIAAGDRPVVQRSDYYAYLSRYRGRSGREAYWYAAACDSGATGILAPDLREWLPPRFDSIEYIDADTDGIDVCSASQRRSERAAGRHAAGLWLAFAKQHVELVSECGPRHEADGIGKVVELRALTDGQPTALWPWNTLVALALDSAKDDRCVYLTAGLTPFARAPRGVNGCRAAITGSGLLALPSEDGNTQLFRFDARGEPRLVGRFDGRLYMQTQDFLVLQRSLSYAVIDGAGRTPFGEDFQDAAPGCGAVPVSLRRGGLWYSLDVNTGTLGKGTPGKPFFFSC